MYDIIDYTRNHNLMRFMLNVQCQHTKLLSIFMNIFIIIIDVYQQIDHKVHVLAFALKG